MWFLKKNSAAQRRADVICVTLDGADILFTRMKFDFTKPEDRSEFGYNYLTWKAA